MSRRLAGLAMVVTFTGLASLVSVAQATQEEPRRVPGLTITTPGLIITLPVLSLTRNTKGPSPVLLRHVSTVGKTFEAEAASFRSFSWSDKNQLEVELGPGSYVSTDAGVKSAKESFAKLFVTFTERGDMISFRIER